MENLHPGIHMDDTLIVTTYLDVPADQLLHMSAALSYSISHRTAVGTTKTAWEILKEHKKESEVVTQTLISPDINLMGSDGISGKQAQTTKTPSDN